MGTPYAEVIGDPIAQSKSPLIHNHWLEKRGIPARFTAVNIPGPGLPDYLSSRSRDPNWRGCSVTLPHKQSVVRLLAKVDSAARRIGAVNCVYRSEGKLVGCNTDVEGIAHALAGLSVDGQKIAIIGAGGAARAAIDYLVAARAGAIGLIVRNPLKAEALRAAERNTVSLCPQSQAELALDGAVLIVNASPLGMSGAQPMPSDLLRAVGRHARGATLFDMVYQSRKTGFLETGHAAGGATVGGLTMLIGQARTAFRLFYGQSAPEGDGDLMQLLQEQAPVGAAGRATRRAQGFF